MLFIQVLIVLVNFVEPYSVNILLVPPWQAPLQSDIFVSLSFLYNSYSKTWLIQNSRDQRKRFWIMKNICSSI
jgi:hypothetical protein